MTDRHFVIENFAYRTGMQFASSSVNVGCGNVYPDVVVIHKGHGTPDRDAITGALHRFNLLDVSYRIPSQIIDLEQIFVGEYAAKFAANRKLLIELLEILRPRLVVCAGELAVNSINTTTKKSSSLIGKSFQLEDLTWCKVCGILDPETYSFARASADVKERGKKQWEAISRFLEKATTKS
jgi:hypothetical protein